MLTSDTVFPQIVAVGERALLITFADTLTTEAVQQVRAVDFHLQRFPLKGVVECIPAYASVLILYDPLRVGMSAVKDWAENACQNLESDAERHPKRIEIVVRYGGAEGPDLPFVAEYHGVSLADVIEKHTGRVYRVGMMGFMPGFAYLLGLDPSIATPRLATPRTHVPAGSVGIAGSQTGIYPLDAPGGWQLIGRTDQVLFDPVNEPYFALSPGDEVCFIPLQDNPLS